MPEKYKNPPVVEAWIDFRFEYGEEASIWNDSVAINFTKSFEQFNQEEHLALFRKEFKISERGPIFSESNPVFQRLKTFNKTKDRCLQIEQNLLVYNMLRKKGIEWPGFSVLLDEAVPFCKAYINMFHPIRIRTVLNYRDHIIIPFTDNKVEPKEYFTIYPEVPAGTFGNIMDYSLSLSLADICKDGIARFSAITRPSLSNDLKPKLPFIIDWSVQSINSFECEDLTACIAWLNSAHDGIHKAFNECLTEKCRDLFS